MIHKGFRSARSRWLAGAAGGVAFALALTAIDLTPPANSAPVQAAPVTSGSFADVVDAVSPAVVNIMVSKTAGAEPTAAFPRSRQGVPRGEGQPFDEFMRRFFEAPDQATPRQHVEGEGSGFLIDADGYIVTNNHVIDGADKIVVTMKDGHKLDAKLVGHDPKTDLALIKVSGSAFPYVSFGDSDHARVGDWVLAIGNPFGLGGTATAGIISARGRDIQSGPYDDYLQLDAPINFGNSGGPVFNSAGQVIGVNTAIFSPNGGNIGIGFAIPANQAKTVIADLKSTGSVERGWLGVQIQNLDDELASSLGVKDAHGALVAEVVGDSPASHAGVEAGDVITRFNDRDIDSARALSRAVADVAPKSTARLTVLRDGKSRELKVKIGEAAPSEQVAENGDHGASGDGETAGSLGLSLRALTDEDRSQLGVPEDTKGALVADVDPDGPAAEKGIRPGDVITEVNHKGVKTPGDAVAALRAAKKGDHALLLVRRGDSQRFVALNRS